MLDFSQIQAVLLDMDGVLYRGQTVLPGVHEFLAFCDEQGIGYACLTNNSTMTPAQYEAKLAGMQISMPARHVLTSGMATNRFLRANYPRGTTIYALGMQGLHEPLFADGYFAPREEQPDLVVQGADFTVVYDKLRIACLAIRAGARFIATNPDKTFPTEAGLIPGAGAITAALQAATDVAPQVIGKPQPTMFELGAELLGSNAATTLMIGDRLDTDIAGACAAGMPAALVLTGVSTAAEAETSATPPTATFADMPTLLDHWRAAR